MERWRCSLLERNTGWGESLPVTIQENVWGLGQGGAQGICAETGSDLGVQVRSMGFCRGPRTRGPDESSLHGKA